jgi:hypothetical protein
MINLNGVKMKITATRKEEIKVPLSIADLIMNVTFVPSRITQQGVHRGEDFYSKDLFTFTWDVPFTCPTEREMESLEYRVTHGLWKGNDQELWGLVK